MTPATWRVSGSYFEACNCQAICPCRRQGGQKLTTGSTYGVCDFALSWRIIEGRWGDLALSGLSAVMAGSYRDDESDKPWRVCLYVDDGGSPAQREALAEIFLGRAPGTAARNFAARITDVYAIRPAAITLEHAPRQWFMQASEHVIVRATTAVPSDLAVTCGIPGHDQPGEELIADVMKVDDGPLRWEVSARCGFASRFDYRSDGA